MKEKNFNLADILGSDPLAKFLLMKLNIKPYIGVIAFVFSGLIYTILIPPLYGYGWTDVDPINWLNIFLVFPAAGYFYIHQPRSILRVYNSAVLFLREEGARQAFTGKKLHQYHDRALWIILPLVIATLSAGLGIAGSLTSFSRFWYNAGWLEIITMSLVRFAAMYMLASIAVRHLATSSALNELFQYVQFPLTLDTDRFDVFYSVKRFALEFVIIAAIVGLNLGLQPLLIPLPMPEYLLYVVLYFILAPLGFFLPLQEAHKRMVNIKEQILVKLHKDFQEESYRLHKSLLKDVRGDYSNRYLKSSETLKSLKDAIEVIEKTPDWPFEGTTLYRIVITILSPYILAASNVIIDMISNFYTKLK